LNGHFHGSCRGLLGGQSQLANFSSPRPLNHCQGVIPGILPPAQLCPATAAPLPLRFCLALTSTLPCKTLAATSGPHLDGRDQVQSQLFETALRANGEYCAHSPAHSDVTPYIPHSVSVVSYAGKQSCPKHGRTSTGRRTSSRHPANRNGSRRGRSNLQRPCDRDFA